MVNSPSGPLSHEPSSKRNRKPPISSRTVREALDAAEVRFTECSRVVGTLSGYHIEELTANNVLDFQMRLYRPISDLEELYRRIKQEEKSLIRDKARFKPHWFAKRMAKLSTYTRQLRDGLMLGRSIGDGFAWFFYERDPQLIDETSIPTTTTF
jgi:hypothetical protein